jgi:hypothetical protein
MKGGMIVEEKNQHKDKKDLKFLINIPIHIYR